MAESIIGWQYKGRVCVAEFFPPGAVEQYEQWKAEHLRQFGPPDEWIVNLGRVEFPRFAGQGWAFGSSC